MTNNDKMKILGNMTIIVDSREKKNQHILDYLDTNNIPWVVEKLDSADYSFILKDYPELNMDKQILIEKKNSLTELCGNFTTNRERFKREFERIKEGQKIHLVVETATWKKLMNGSYRSQFNPKAYTASLLSYSIRYNMKVWFVETSESPELIYRIMYYELNEFLNSIK